MDKRNNSGLKPTKGWRRRNYTFFRHRVIPQIFKEPQGSPYTLEPRPVEKGHARVYWIGHASVYIEFHDRTLLIDPVWGTWLGFIKRQTVPGIPLITIPPVDLTLVSHAHVDHLHRHTLRQITSQEGIVLPLHCTPIVKDLKFSSTTELALWDEVEKAGISVTLTPCYHWGARWGLDTHRGYGGFLIKYDGVTVYYAGDSAYFSGFSEIAEKYAGQIDLAILPIGAYAAPSGRKVHMTPEEAVEVFQEVQATAMIPVHHDTYPLGNERVGEAPERLLKAAELQGVSAQVYLLQPGQYYETERRSE